MISAPASVVSTWPAPNYSDPQTLGNSIVVVNALLLTLMVVSLGLRLYVRVKLTRWYGWDDSLICVAAVSFLLAKEDEADEERRSRRLGWAYV
jgi:hypothetical protein